MDNNNRCAVVNCRKPVKRFLITEQLWGIMMSVPLCKDHYHEYDGGVKDSKSGDEHCDFVERFANELIEIATDHGELELIRGFNKAEK